MDRRLATESKLCWHTLPYATTRGDRSSLSGGTDAGGDCVHARGRASGHGEEPVAARIVVAMAKAEIQLKEYIRAV